MSGFHVTCSSNTGFPAKKSQTVIIKSLICHEAKLPLYWTSAERITTLQFTVPSSNVPDGRELGSVLYQFIPGSTIRQTFSISATSRSVILWEYQKVLYSQKFVTVLITFKAWQTPLFYSWNAKKCMRLLLVAIPNLLQIFPCSRFKPLETELWVFRVAHFKVLSKQISPSKVVNSLRKHCNLYDERISQYLQANSKVFLNLNSKLTQKKISEVCNSSAYGID